MAMGIQSISHNQSRYSKKVSKKLRSKSSSTTSWIDIVLGLDLMNLFMLGGNRSQHPRIAS
jgi:hypothetical protein